VDFARYALRFLFLGPIQLTRYLRAHGRERLARGLAIGTAAHLVGLALLFVLDPAATLVVFGIPALLMPAALMAGDWAQHALVDPDDPTNPWRSSITLVNSRHNRRCYNDGYPFTTICVRACTGRRSRRHSSRRSNATRRRMRWCWTAWTATGTYGST
jgi:hypothetical protein